MSTDPVTLSSHNTPLHQDTPPPQPTNMKFPNLPEYPYTFGKHTYCMGKASPEDICADLNETLARFGYDAEWRGSHCFVDFTFHEIESQGLIDCFTDSDGNQVLEFRRIKGCAIHYHHALASVLARLGLQEPPVYPPAPDLDSLHTAI